MRRTSYTERISGTTSHLGLRDKDGNKLAAKGPTKIVKAAAICREAGGKSLNGEFIASIHSPKGEAGNKLGKDVTYSFRKPDNGIVSSGVVGCVINMKLLLEQVEAAWQNDSTVSVRISDSSKNLMQMLFRKNVTPLCDSRWYLRAVPAKKLGKFNPHNFSDALQRYHIKVFDF